MAITQLIPFRGQRRPPLAAVLLVALILPASAGALDLDGFMPRAGDGAVAFSQTAESYDSFWVGDSRVSDPGLGEVETAASSLWLTWGLRDDLALVANFAWVDVDTDGSAGFAVDGAQDVTALLKYRFAELERGPARHAFLAAGGARTPLSDYEGNAPISLGDGTTDALVRFVYHYENAGFYLAQQVGYDLRGGDAPDGLPLFTELGYTFGRLTLSAFYCDYRADGGTDIGDPGFTFPSNEDEYRRVGAKLFARVAPGFGLVVHGFDTLDGRNSGDASGFSVGGTFAF